MVTQAEQEKYSPLPQSSRGLAEIVPEYSQAVKNKLGFQGWAFEQEHELNPQPFAESLAWRAAKGDAEALKLLSYDVVELVPNLLADHDKESLCALIDCTPSLIDTRLEGTQAAKNTSVFMRLLRRTADALFRYQERMRTVHPYFAQPLTFSKLPSSAVMSAPKGSWQLPHIHRGVILTAVYYLRPPRENCGGLFQIGGHCKTFTPGTPDHVPITWTLPLENSLLILPAYLVHGVTDYFGDFPRLSIAFGM